MKALLRIFNLVVGLQFVFVAAAWGATPLNLSLSNSFIVIDKPPVAMTVNGGTPPYLVKQVGGTSSLTIQQTGNNTFNLIGRGPGKTTIEVTDKPGSGSVPKRVDISIGLAPPLEISLSASPGDKQFTWGTS
jgi:hypothetical protein